MILHEGDRILICGQDQGWCASYDSEKVAGPLEIEFSAATRLAACTTSIDDLNEELAFLQNIKAFRKGKVAALDSDGALPFGACVRFANKHRYTENSFRVVKDIHIPRGTVLRNKLELDTLVFEGDFVEWCQADDAFQLQPWEPISPQTQTSTQHPSVVLFKDSDGRVFEFGVGSDVWRWTSGLFPGNNRGAYELVIAKDRIVLKRVISVVEEEIEPECRPFRFSWYMAWDQPNAGKSAESLVDVTWRPNGDLAVGVLNEKLNDTPNATVNINICDLPWPDPLRKPNGYPCFSSSSVIKRLKRVVRQLSHVEPASFPIRFTGLHPGPCKVGRHVNRRKETAHWDLTALLEFGAWTRQQLGDERVILADSTAFDTPSIRTMFAATDHDVEQAELDIIAEGD